VDGLSNKDSNGTRLIIKSPQEERHEHALRFMFKAPNNEVECKSLIVGVDLCYTAGADSVRLLSNSQLIVDQLSGEYEVKFDTIQPMSDGYGSHSTIEAFPDNTYIVVGKSISGCSIETG